MTEEFPLESTHVNDEGILEIDCELLLTLKNGNHVVGIYVDTEESLARDKQKIPYGFQGITCDTNEVFEIPEVVAWKYIMED